MPSFVFYSPKEVMHLMERIKLELLLKQQESERKREERKAKAEMLDEVQQKRMKRASESRR